MLRLPPSVFSGRFLVAKGGFRPERASQLRTWTYHLHQRWRDKQHRDVPDYARKAALPQPFSSGSMRISVRLAIFVFNLHPMVELTLSRDHQRNGPGQHNRRKRNAKSGCVCVPGARKEGREREGGRERGREESGRAGEREKERREERERERERGRGLSVSLNLNERKEDSRKESEFN